MAKEDGEYPEWLWGLLGDKGTKGGMGDGGEGGDEFGEFLFSFSTRKGFWRMGLGGTYEYSIEECLDQEIE